MWSFSWGCTNGGVPPVLKKWKLAPEIEAGAIDSLTPQTAIIFYIYLLTYSLNMSLHLFLFGFFTIG